MTAKIKKVENIINNLPAGVSVGEKPNNLEFLGRRAGKYDSVIETLKVLHSTTCVKISVENPSKSIIQAIKWGICSAGKRLNLNKHIKFAFDDSAHILYVWVN